MPKKSTVARSEKRKKRSNNTLVTARRKELKALLKTEEKGIEAMFALQKNKNSSKVRVVNRCSSCNRARGVYRFFNLCRLCLIKNAGLGIIPGLRLSSW